MSTKWDMVPYDVQLVGAIVLHEGRIAEMATGEGKTLVALMPVYLNALTGKGVHLVTVNDYLARRDREWVGPILEYLGLTLGVIQHDLSPAQRRAAYAADVTYGTNNEFGFDYLRDNMAIRAEEQVQRPHHFAIIDEVDNILIDEARTPLIISGPVTQTHTYFTDMKPQVERVVRAQSAMVSSWMSEIEAVLEKEGYEEPTYETATRLLQVKRGAPKNKRFMKLTSDHPGLQKAMRKVEFDATRDKRMGEIDQDLFYTIEEKNREIDLTDKGRAGHGAPTIPTCSSFPISRWRWRRSRPARSSSPTCGSRRRRRRSGATRSGRTASTPPCSSCARTRSTRRTWSTSSRTARCSSWTSSPDASCPGAAGRTASTRRWRPRRG